MYLLGYDIGSSSIKAALVDAQTQETVGLVRYPESEMDIISRQSGWAEQHPEIWWENLQKATQLLLKTCNVSAGQILSIGIAYQMHGLILIDKDQRVLRSAIIWCDSRAVHIGAQAEQALGESWCQEHLLNSPGNFTASKLKWVKDNEPELFDQIDKVLLPGDFINMKMTGEVNTTVAALSEGIFWDFKRHSISEDLLAHFGFEASLFPEILETCENHGVLSSTAARLLGLKKGTPVTYRAGDQPNNALSLNVLQPGEIAATGGTSGVVFGVTDAPLADEASRINAFAHVNHSFAYPRVGMLLCINGAGIQYSWLKQMLAQEGTTYESIGRMLSSVPVNSDGLVVLPFGNGAERMLGNRDIGSRVLNLNFNRHGKAHLYRAGLEGVAYAFIYGIKIMKSLGMELGRIKVGNDNLFQSSVFSNTIASVLGCEIEVLESTGAVGAALASGKGINHFAHLEEAMAGLRTVQTFTPAPDKNLYESGYRLWHSELRKILNWNNNHLNHEHSYRREILL